MTVAVTGQREPAHATPETPELREELLRDDTAERFERTLAALEGVAEDMENGAIDLDDLVRVRHRFTRATTRLLIALVDGEAGEQTADLMNGVIAEVATRDGQPVLIFPDGDIASVRMSRRAGAG